MNVVFAYDFPHRKSFDGLIRLIVSGNAPDIVLAAPWVDLPTATLPSIRISPIGVEYPRISELCRTYGIKYVNHPHNSAETVKLLEFARPKMGIILGARILKQEVIEKFEVGVINMHPGCLPHNRGLDNLKWAIFDGLPQAVTTHFIDSKIDLGRVIDVSIVPVYSDDTYLDIFLRTQSLEITRLIEILQRIKQQDFGSWTIVEGKYNSVMSNKDEGTLNDIFSDYKRNYSLIVSKYLDSNQHFPFIKNLMIR